MTPDPGILLPGGPQLFLAGPTAVGKSEIALLLAERLGGEIISVDSMQVYRGLDIGTAKPSLIDRQRVPHHLIDVAALDEPFDAARFVKLAREAAEGIRARNRIPVFVGGTGLYFQACIEGLGAAPPADPTLRAALESAPLPELLRELERGDPVTFAKIDHKNRRRIMRAIEVIRLTGRPFSTQRAAWSGSSLGPQSQEGQVLRLAMTRPTEELHRRIDERVERMFARGLIAEAEALLARGLAGNRTAMQAIGYRQVVEHLHGMRSLSETVVLVKQRTRQFAKRQLTWFRHQGAWQWVTVHEPETPAATAERIVRAFLSEK